VRIIGEKDAEFHRRLALKRAVPPALAKAALDVRDSILVKQAHESFLAAGRQFLPIPVGALLPPPRVRPVPPQLRGRRMSSRNLLASAAGARPDHRVWRRVIGARTSAPTGRSSFCSQAHARSAVMRCQGGSSDRRSGAAFCARQGARERRLRVLPRRLMAVVLCARAPRDAHLRTFARYESQASVVVEQAALVR
jgi:hypothetical protein